MGLDDLIKQKYRHKTSHNHHNDNDHDGRYRRHAHSDDHAYRHGDSHSYGGYQHGHHKQEMILSILKALPHKKALLTGAVIICLVIIILGIALLWTIFPLITQAAGYVDANGIKGITDAVLPLIQKLWEGSGK